MIEKWDRLLAICFSSGGLCRLIFTWFVLLALLLNSAEAQVQGSRERTVLQDATVRQALTRAVKFYRDELSKHGGYVYQYAANSSKREGEGAVGLTTGWVEPPGTPFVGQTYLNAYRLCGDPILLEAAVDAANALIMGQLESGGWGNQIEFGHDDRNRYAYRVDAGLKKDRSQKKSNVTTLDDNKSQSAASFLMHLDRELAFKNAAVHEATLYALNSFISVQYSNGAWPQRYDGFSESALAKAATPASFPETWSRVYPGKKYGAYYTLNDNTISDMIQLMLGAWDIYHDRKYLSAAKSGGDFLILAQLPTPQPGWAQQYDEQMNPAWARRFEPPALTGGESQAVMKTLLMLYRRLAANDDDADRYLRPLQPALDYYRASLREDGKLARFYELETNRPLYMTRKYELTYRDDDLPTHYSFVVSSKLERLQAELDEVQITPKERLWKPTALQPSVRTDRLEHEVRKVLAKMDERGAWVESGKLKYHGQDDKTTMVIRSTTFCHHLLVLAGWLGGTI